MKQTGELKKQAEIIDNRDEKRIIEEAGRELTEDELGTVSGGLEKRYNPFADFEAELQKGHHDIPNGITRSL